MKNYRLIIAFALSFLAVLSTSCSDFLDKQPDDQMTMEMVFSDKVNTEQWLAGVYTSVPNTIWGYFKDQGYNIMADDITIPQDWSPYGWKNVYNYTTGNWNATSAWNPNYWVTLPIRIRSALIFIENVRVIPAIGLTEAYVSQMKAEARFLIAYYYSLLIEHYGPVPFRPESVVSVGAEMDELMATQTPYDEIVEWLDKEFVEVSKLLPAVYENRSDWGRATAVACLAMRAKMLLMAASPLYNGNEDYAEWVNSDGEHLMSTSYDESKWTRAANAFKDLITAAEAAGHGLYYEYNPDGTIDPFMSYYNCTLKKTSEGNNEILWGRSESHDYHYYEEHKLPKGIKGNAAMGTTQELVDAFFMKNGEVPILGYNEDGSPIINAASGYVEKGFSSAAELRYTQWPGGGPAELGDKKAGMSPVTTADTYNMYCNREPRFYVSVIFNHKWLMCDNRHVDYLQGGKDTDMSFDSPQNGYNVRKGVPLDVNPRLGKYVYVPEVLYRMADAYLGYAEALNESKSAPDAEVYQYIDKVRERAGLPGLKAGLSKEEMREAIQRERRVELNCEGIRFHDVRRWKLGEKYFNCKLYGMNHDGNQATEDPGNPNSFYFRKFYKSRSFSKRMYMWPVPQAQMDINPNLRQNPLY